ETSDYTFPAGKYACKNFIVENEKILETQIEQFLEELKTPAQNWLIHENIYPSLAYPQAMVYTMEVPI
ncbi:TPA: transcriptional regulator, partial [Listeria monocytogenes]|nr:transcriptional regulator [Listeria monocytogenes]